MGRIVFYSKEDLAWSFQLPKVESALDNLIPLENLDINDNLELYSIKLYFDNNIYLSEWDLTTINRLLEKVNQGFERVKTFFINISNENILVLLDKLDFNYIESFWDLIQKFDQFKKIDKTIFEVILQRFSNHINVILLYNRIVKYYNGQIRSFLLNYKDAAVLILSYFEQVHQTPQRKKYFPSCLTIEDKELIIDKYLDITDANINYVDLIINSKKSPDLKLSPKIRHKAKKLHDKLTSELFAKSTGLSFGVNVIISKEQIEPNKYIEKDCVLEASYSESFLNKIHDDVDFINLFKVFFGFINEVGIIQLLANPRNDGIWQIMGLSSKNEYPTGPVFQQFNMLSISQIAMLEHYLTTRSINFVSLIAAFINHLNTLIVPSQIYFQLPSVSTSFHEKNSVFASSFEILLKQYHLYALENEIDHDLVNMNIDTLNFGDLGSLLPKKYIYSNGATIVNEIAHYFFSPNSMLLYSIDKKKKYKTFYEYLLYEKLLLSDFSKPYLQQIIQKFINESYLGCDENEILHTRKDIEIALIGQIYFDNVISYWHYDLEVRAVIDSMLDKNLLCFESKLFTRGETDYFNFNLNDKKFTNGYKLKNKYSHGFIATDETSFKNDYYYYLRIIILGLLKIEDDLLLFKHNISS